MLLGLWHRASMPRRMLSSRCPVIPWVIRAAEIKARVAQPQLLTVPLRKRLPSLMVSFPHAQRHSHFGRGEAPKRSTTVKRPNFWPVMLIAGIGMISPPKTDDHGLNRRTVSQGQVAEGTGLASNLLHIKSLILNYYFSRNAPHERFQHCKRLTWRCRLVRAASSSPPASRWLLLPLDRENIDDSTLRKSDAP